VTGDFKKVEEKTLRKLAMKRRTMPVGGVEMTSRRAVQEKAGDLDHPGGCSVDCNAERKSSPAFARSERLARRWSGCRDSVSQAVL
jgi:hypothetical protein